MEGDFLGRITWKEDQHANADIPLTWVPVQGTDTEQCSSEGGELPSDGEAAVPKDLPASFQEPSSQSHSSSLSRSLPLPWRSPGYRAGLVLLCCFCRIYRLLLISKPYLIFTELSSLMFCPDAHCPHSAHN